MTATILNWTAGDHRARPGEADPCGAQMQMMRSWAALAKMIAPELTPNEKIDGITVTDEGIYFVIGRKNTKAF